MVQKSKDFVSKLNINKSTVAVLICLVAAIVFVSFFTPMYNINQIIVEGNSKVDADTLVRASGIQEGTNIFAVNMGEAKERVSRVAYINSVKIRRRLPAGIKITVTESSECAYINFVGNYVGIDEKGKILDVKQQISEFDKPVITGIGLNSFEIGSQIDVSDKNKEKVLFEILGQVKNSGIETSIQYMDINDFENINFTLRNKVAVKLGSTAGIRYKIAYLKSVIDELGEVTGGIIDITDTENVFYTAN